MKTIIFFKKRVDLYKIALRYLILFALVYSSLISTVWAIFEEKTLGFVYMGGINQTSLPDDSVASIYFSDWTISLLTKKEETSVDFTFVINPYYQSSNSSLIMYDAAGLQVGFNVIVGQGGFVTTYTEYGVNYGKIWISKGSYENSDGSYSNAEWNWEKQNQIIDGYYGKYYQLFSNFGLYTEFGQKFYSVDAEFIQYKENSSEIEKSEKQTWQISSFYIILGLMITF
jgi:hypothetical protein